MEFIFHTTTFDTFDSTRYGLGPKSDFGYYFHVCIGKYYGGQRLLCIWYRHRPSQGLITVVLLISWLHPSIFTFGSHVEVVDMFAGAGRIARMARQSGQRAVALDIAYSSHSHCFDINEDAGFAFLYPNRNSNMPLFTYLFFIYF